MYCTGDAVLHNLVRNGFTVTSISDIDPSKCRGYPDTVKVLRTNREVAEDADVIITGKSQVLLWSKKGAK